MLIHVIIISNVSVCDVMLEKWMCCSVNNNFDKMVYFAVIFMYLKSRSILLHCDI